MSRVNYSVYVGRTKYINEDRLDKLKQMFTMRHIAYDGSTWGGNKARRMLKRKPVLRIKF